MATATFNSAQKPELPPKLLSTLSQVERFAQSPFTYASWTPAQQVWSSREAQRIDSLQLPKTSELAHRTADPDLVLYGLGRMHELDAAYPSRLDSLAADQSHTLLVNTSGSGKTKIVLETLHRHWGLYFTTSADAGSNPYGSQDLEMTVRLFEADSPHRTLPLKTRPEAEWLPLLRRNQSLLAARVESLVLCRLILLERFLAYTDAAAISDDEARVKWFWMQVRPAETVGFDFFRFTMTELRSWTPSDRAARLNELVTRFGPKLTFVAVDEAQQLSHHYSSAFADATLTEFRPTLREILFCLASQLRASRLIISGTRVDFAIADDAIKSSDSHTTALREFCQLDRFMDEDHTRQYLRHFLGSKVSAENAALAHRWLRGRHRFLTVLVQHTLIHGLRQFVTVLDSILRESTGFRRSGTSASTVRVDIDHVMSDERLEASEFAPLLRTVLYSNLAQGSVPVLVDRARELVGTGLAYFVDDMDHAYIDEPVVLLNLARWLRRSATYQTSAFLRRRLDDSTVSLKEFSTVAGFALMLWRQYATSGLRLDDIAWFQEATPSWAEQPAHFALSSLDGTTRAFEAVTFLDGPLVHAADRAEDVVKWFRASKSPFLIPDDDMGPQLVFLLDAQDGHWLVFVHLEPFTTNRPRRHDQVVPQNPYMFYAKKRSMRKEFRALLATFPSDDPAARGTARLPTYNTIQIYCFAELQHTHRARDPAVAELRIEDILREDDLPELEQQDVESGIR